MRPHGKRFTKRVAETDAEQYGRPTSDEISRENITSKSRSGGDDADGFCRMLFASVNFANQTSPTGPKTNSFIFFPFWIRGPRHCSSRPTREAEALRRAVAGQPRSTAARSVLGAILEQRGQSKEAEAEFREALRLDANSTVALTNLGVLLVHAGRANEAVTTFERVLRLAPGHPQATFNLAALYVARKDYVRAIPLMERAAGVNVSRRAETISRSC